MNSAFSHEALVYDSEDTYVRCVVPFVREGLACDESVLVATTPERLRVLRGALGEDAGRVRMEDMTRLGHNPAVIIPAWQAFSDEQKAAGRGVRGVGEPCYHGRNPDEVVECHRHEALLNVAFDGSGSWRLLCPYDAAALDPAIVDDALRTHPWIWEDGSVVPSPRYHGGHAAFEHFALELPDLGPPAAATFFGAADLRLVRTLTAESARAAGMTRARRHDATVVVSELVTNSIRHGGAGGALALWVHDDTLVCEVRDDGLIEDPLVGRVRPGRAARSGWGLWLCHQLCDLLQIRTTEVGTVIRAHLHAAAPGSGGEPELTAAVSC